MKVENLKYDKEVHQKLHTLLTTSIKLHCFDLIDSTNDFLLDYPLNAKTQVCIANSQLKGRGQYGRHWEGEKGGSILLSMRYCFSARDSLNGLSLVIGLSAVKVIRAMFSISKLQLKWPNDIYYQHQKLGGILIENKLQGENLYAVIGLGINLKFTKRHFSSIDLVHILGYMPDKYLFYKNLVQQILDDIERFKRYKFGAFYEDWRAFDYLYARKINLRNGRSYKAIGVDKERGALLLKNKGELKRIYSSNAIIKVE